MTAPTDDDPVSGFGAPASGIDDRAHADGRVDPPVGARSGAHAQPVEVPVVAVARQAPADRRRYFLSSLEPSGEFDAVILAVTDGTRRRYFTTRDGTEFAEIDGASFDRRSEDGARSLLELDERELGELEAELQFVRPVRGRDPVAEAEDRDGVEPEPEPEPDPEPEPEPDPHPDSDPENEYAAVPAPSAYEQPDAGDDDDEEVRDLDDETYPAEEVDPVTEEFEAMVQESRRSTFVHAEAATSDAVKVVEEVEVASEPASERAGLSPSAAIEQVALARGIAFMAHRGQLDRSGLPYIDHPGRIAERFDAATEPVEAAAAWLHDVLEDTAVTAQELFEAGVRPEVIEVVQLLTRTTDVAADEYYARIRGDAIARRVKLADIDDNTARWRLRRLDYEVQLRLIEKYRVARRALGSH